MRRATTKLPASDVMPDTIRGYGFYAECACTWHGKTQRSYALARKDLRAHKLWHVEGAQITLAGPL